MALSELKNLFLDDFKPMDRPELKKIFSQSFSISEPAEWFMEGLGVRNISGVSITPKNSLQIAAVFSCVRLLSETVASLPFFVYKSGNDGSKSPDRAHPLFTILHSIPNPEMTSFNLRETLMLHLLLRGNAYAQKIYDRGGRLRQLWPLKSEDVKPFRDKNTENELKYRVVVDGVSQILTKRDIWHIPGLSWNGVEGLSPISLARETLGLSKSQEMFSSNVFGNQARISGVLEHPMKLSDDAYKRLKESWRKQYQGIENAGETAILEEGLKFKEVSMSNEDAQFLESRNFSVAEIARIFRVPLHMIYAVESQPRANMEMASLEFVEYSLRQWLVRIEQSANKDLISNGDRTKIFVEHNVDGLLRGAFKDRMTGYATARQWGWMSVNDIRKKENMNPIGEDGDEYLRPLNMIPVGEEMNANET